MEIECTKCGNKINLDETLKDSVLAGEIKKNNEILQEKHNEELVKAKKAFEREFDSRENEISANFEKEIEFLKSQREKNKNEEIELKRRNLELEDALKESSILAEQKAKETLEKKEKELAKKNSETLSKMFEESQNEFDELKRNLHLEMESNLKEKDLENQRLLRRVQEVKRELDIVKQSQELVGEAAELLLLERLKNGFPYHSFEEIKKGASGADIIQYVKLTSGKMIGQIYYESKKTRRWSEGWIEKFKTDMRKKGANAGILVSEALPNYCENFCYKDGVWISSPKYAVSLASAVSKELISVHKATSIKNSKSSLQGEVYDYICSDSFIVKMKAIADAHIAQTTELEKEKVAFNKIWASRRKNIDKSLENLAEIVGDLECLSNGRIKSLDTFDLNLPE